MAPSTTALSPAAFSTFGELLRYLRRRQRLTQIELAIAVGSSTAQISRIEQNQRRPNPSTVQALFIPALGLEQEPGMVARLLDLARAARDQRDADAWLSDLDSADTAGLSGQEPGSARDQQTTLDPEPSAQILLTKLYLTRRRVDLVPRPRLLAHAESNARMHSVIEILVVQALAYDAAGDRARALTALERTLGLAEPEGYIRVFVDEGATLAALLHEPHVHRGMPAYIDKLLVAFPVPDTETRR